LSLDVSWTPVRWGYQIDENGAEEYQLHAVAELAVPKIREMAIKEAREEYLGNMRQSIKEAEEKGDGVDENPPTRIPLPNRLDRQVDPDEHLLCFDYLYFTSTHKRGEFWWEDSPIWNAIGTHLHFSTRILELSTSYLLKTFSLSPSEDLPPFISIHIRRNDFTVWCGDVVKDDCLAPLSAYIRRVEEVKPGLLEAKPELMKNAGNGRRAEDIKVVVFTDEPHITSQNSGDPPGTSEAWWKAIDDLGWKSIRHDLEQTEEKYGAWYPSILDACMMAMGSAFVGTDRSTYSLIAKRRVEDWAGGPARLVKWGFIGADDH